jgi:hypothetical protein
MLLQWSEAVTGFLGTERKEGQWTSRMCKLVAHRAFSRRTFATWAPNAWFMQESSAFCRFALRMRIY